MVRRVKEYKRHITLTGTILSVLIVVFFIIAGCDNPLNDIIQDDEEKYLDTVPPVITEFTLTSGDPATSRDITFDLAGNDDVSGIAGWLINETAATPDPDAGGWVIELPTGYQLSVGDGEKTVYAWAKDGAGNVSDSLSFTVDLQATPEGALQGSTDIVGHESIIIEFTNSMNTSDVEAHITGDLGSAGMTFIWSESSNPNDTLELKPTTIWPIGSGETLIINGEAANGIAMAEFSTSFEISARFHVSDATGSDLVTAGTTSSPCLTIQYALDRADALYTTAEVRVAEGLYDLTSTVAVIPEGISIYGGYSDTDWVNQDINGKEVKLQINYSGTTTTNTIECGIDITGQTIIDGITVIMATGTNDNRAIFCEGSPVIQNVTIQGRESGDGGNYKSGIYVTGSAASPEIRDCTIDPGICTNNQGYGIYINGDATPLIQDNTIYGGTGDTGIETYSVFITNADASPYPRIVSNDLYPGESAQYSSHISLGLNSAAVITSNNFRKPANPTANHWNIYEAFASGDPVSVENNTFYCNYGNLYFKEGSASIVYNAVDVDTTISLKDATTGQLIGGSWGNTRSY